MAESMAEGRFVRWQSSTRIQLGYIANLILTFATASLGFSLNLLKDDLPNGSACFSSSPIEFAIPAFLGSIALGIWCAINRLHDFRETAQMAKTRERMEREGKRLGSDDKMTRNEVNAYLKEWRTLNGRRGTFTWTLFYWQIGTFGVGVLFLVAAFIGSRLRVI